MPRKLLATKGLESNGTVVSGGVGDFSGIDIFLSESRIHETTSAAAAAAAGVRRVPAFSLQNFSSAESCLC
jgi:hypothetical protein